MNLRNNEVRRFVINESSSGDRTIIPAVTAKRLRVLSYKARAAAGVTLTWKSGSNAISGPLTMGTNGVDDAPPSEWGSIETNPGEALVLNLSGAVAVGGFGTYVEL